MRRFSIAAILLVCTLLGALTYKVHAQRAALLGPSGGSGVIEGASIDLSSRIAARVQKIHAKKGQKVKAGTLLVELDCTEPLTRLAEANARIIAASSQAKAARAQVEMATKSKSAASAAAAAAGAKIKAVDVHESAAKREAERVGTLGKYASGARVDQAQDMLSTLHHEREAALAQSQATSAQAEVAGAQTSVAAASAEAAEQGIGALEALKRLAEIQVAECSIFAPREAWVEEIHFEVGELVLPGSAVLRLIDLLDLTATFYLPNAELGAAKLGRKALIVADAWPDQRFEGEVITVSNRAEFTPRNIQTRSDRDRLVYEIEVQIRGGEAHLRPGMPVQVSLLEEIRP